MKSHLHLLFCPLALTALLSAQTAAPAPAAPAAPTVHCTVAAERPPTDADRAFSAGDFAKSEQLYSAEVAAAPTPDAYVGLTRSQLRQQKTDEALATAKKAVAASPASAEAQTLLGEALLRSSQIMEASAAFSKATSLNRCYARGHLGAGKLLDLASMHATALREFTVAHQLAPGDDEIRMAWIKSLAPSQRTGALREFLAEAKNLTPDQRQTLAAELALLEKGKTCHLATPVATAKLDLFPLLYNGTLTRDWGLNAKFNGHKSTLLELDTSVSGIVLGRDFAAKAGIENILGTQSSGPGASSGYMGYADSVKIGPFDFKDCPIRVVDDAALAKSNSLVSADLFKDYLVTVNFANRTFSLAPLPKKPDAPAVADAPQDRYAAPELKDWTRVYVADDRILVPTGINSSGPFLFMLDTGTVFTTLSPTVARTVLDISPDITAPIQGVSGDFVKVFFKEGGADVYNSRVFGPHGEKVKVTRPSKSAVYHFGTYTMLDNKGYAFDMTPLSSNTGLEISGLLGFPIMKDFGVAIDYRDGLIQFIIDKNHLYRTREGSYF